MKACRETGQKTVEKKERKEKDVERKDSRKEEKDTTDEKDTTGNRLLDLSITADWEA